MRMNPQPLVSIVTPSLNQGPYIEQTIRSVLEQDYPHIEYIVVDGGSTDGTLDILEKYNGRLFYSSEPDAGQADAINKGWRRSKGDILAYLNSDDTYCPGAVRKAVEGFRLHPEAGIVYGDCYGTDPEGRIIRRLRLREVDLPDLLCFTILHQPAVFIRRAVTDRVGLLDTRLEGLMDHDLWIRSAFRFPFHHVPEFLACGREHPGSKNANLGVRFGQEAIAILDRTFSDPLMSQRVHALKNKAYAGSYLMAAFWGCLSGERQRSKGFLLNALKLNPRLLFHQLTLPLVLECFLRIPVIPLLRGVKQRWIHRWEIFTAFGKNLMGGNGFVKR